LRGVVVCFEGGGGCWVGVSGCVLRPGMQTFPAPLHHKRRSLGAAAVRVVVAVQARIAVMKANC